MRDAMSRRNLAQKQQSKRPSANGDDRFALLTSPSRGLDTAGLDSQFKYAALS